MPPLAPKPLRCRDESSASIQNVYIFIVVYFALRQILETVHRSLGSDDEGLVIANDCDTDRAYMLVHQCRRINSPLLMVTTHKGQDFPTILPESRKGGDDGGGAFDRVLCDAPCSGDGTLRKTPNIWAKWSTSSAYSLYPLQLMIAQRGLKLVKEGGILVYSTCSMSPYGTNYFILVW